ncbi:hypothetical protein D0T53_10970 [Dysgonomonas sp. 216]|uniref:hypothetical protein n=1 Tax=Dysgonomonas sp. 216 TaxID=2302934 RepID=UPI0013CFD2A6|nr:hypothetical protein [Dysgonomonas sp. 216]NDW19426.1 hypothetical protein [Dysgonomonas sp. 216]
MDSTLHHLEKLKDNLVKTIADLETMFRMPVLIVDTASVPDINVFVEEWKKHQSKILPLPAGSYEFSYRIEDKFQEMIDKHKEYLLFVNSEINKYHNHGNN